MKKTEKLIEDILDENRLIEGVLSNLKKKDKTSYSKVDIKPVVIRDSLYYQFTYHYRDKVEHENMEVEDAKFRILSLLFKKFRQFMIFTEEKDYQILISKKGKIKTIKNPASKKMGDLSHNRRKNYILNDGDQIDFLIRLGVMDKNGRVIAKRYDKFRQINRFLELVDHSMDSLDKKDRINIVDFGCGKSYLTFALYYYLVEIKKIDAHIIGLDLKKDVIDFCNNIARDLAYKNLDFIYGDIESYTSQVDVDMVVSLHACDIATDAALVKAVDWGAKIILSVPCCQHELFSKINKKNMSPMLKHGIIKEKLSSLVTDSLRGQILELLSYDVQLLEFIDMEHTPKNILIRAVRTDRINPKAKEEYLEFKKAWGLEDLYIERELKKYDLEF